jgi:Bacterial Ig-like domain
VVYVSLSPGALPTGAQAVITNQATGWYVTTALMDGGFDPVPLAASIGDTLAIDITSAASTVLAHVRLAVSPVRPLKVVRTSPPSGGRDVPLNAIMVIVFSEPIAPTTVDTTTVALTTGTTRVRGKVALSSDGLRVSFTPDSLLVPNRSYVLSLGSGITSAAGLALVAPVQSSFTTSASLTSGLTALALYGGLNQTVEPGGSLQLHAVERDAAGNVVLNVPVTYVLLHPATDFTTSVTPDGLVTGLALGTDTIVATASGGLSGRVPVAVVPTGGIPFLGMWDVVQNVGGTCYSGSFLIRPYGNVPNGNVPWVQSNLDPGCAAPIGTVGPSGLAFSTALGQMDTLTLFSTQSYGGGGNPGCDWSGEYVSTPEPHIAGSVVNEDTVSNSWHVLICGLGSGTWVATPPRPVAAITATPQQVACAVGTTSFATVSMQNVLGNRVGRYPLQVTSDNPGVAGQDTNWVSNGGAIAVAGTLAVLCKAVGQTQLHITQDLATATIAVTVTP